MHDEEYLRYVGLKVHLSDDGVNWRECCGQYGDDTALFYADDRANEVDKIATHSFKGLEAARFFRVTPLTDLRWIGDDEKCFRFEVLGCDQTSSFFSPTTNLTVEAVAAGFIVAEWSEPVARIAWRRFVRLDIPYYLVTVTTDRNEKVYNVTDNALILSTPEWGVDYDINIICAFQGHFVDCGGQRFSALINAPDSCFAHETSCPISDHVVFALPSELSATATDDKSAVVSWKNPDSNLRGWRASKMRLQIRDLMGPTFFDSDGEGNHIHIPNLRNRVEYAFELGPGGNGIPRRIRSRKASIVMRE